MSFYLLTEPPGQWSLEWTVVEAASEAEARALVNHPEAGGCELLDVKPAAPRVIWSHEESPDSPRGGDY